MPATLRCCQLPSATSRFHPAYGSHAERHFFARRTPLASARRHQLGRHVACPAAKLAGTWLALPANLAGTWLALLPTSNMENSKVPTKVTVSFQRDRVVITVPLACIRSGAHFVTDAASVRDLLGPEVLSGRTLGSKRQRHARNTEDGFLTPSELVQQKGGELTIAGAAQVLGISTEGVRQAVKRNALQHRYVGSVCLIDASSVASYRPRRRGSQLKVAPASTKKSGGEVLDDSRGAPVGNFMRERERHGTHEPA